MSPANPFLPPPAAPRLVLNTHTTSEYAIDLPASWVLLPSDDPDAVTFGSDADRAGLFITVDFYDIPADKARGTAERLINSRLADHGKDAPGPVDVFDSGTRPHAQGTGLEMHYAAQIARGDVVMHAVYVMPRRVLNLTLVTRQDRATALALFDSVRAHFRPLPA